MAADSSWESVVKNLTGFDGGTRINVAAVGGAEAGAGDGSEWMSIKIDPGTDYRATTPHLEPEGAKLGRTMKFYGPPGTGSANVGVYTVTLTLPMSSSNGADWSDGGNAGIYDWGYGAVLGQLKTQHHTIGFGSGYRDDKGVKEPDAVDLRTFPATARAFDRVTEYFTTQSPVLEGWVKDLDGEYSAYRGTGADVFRDLIDALGIGYKDLLQTLSSTAQGTKSVSDPSYESKSVVSDKVLQAEEALAKAAGTLRTAWDEWLKTNMWLGTAHLDKLLDEVATWLNTNNISKMQQNKYEVSQAGANFTTVWDKYGDLTQEATWKNISKAAYTSWAQTLVALDAAAAKAQQELHDALARLSTNADFTFKPGVKSLTEANAADQAGKAKADADEQLKNEKDDAKKEVDQQKEDMQKEQDDAKKEMENLKNGGGGDGGIKPPPLDPNKTGGNEFGGIGGGKDGGGLGDNSEKPPTTGKIPPLGLNDTGGNGGAGLGDSIKNPDGSVTSKNPDGSMVTTFPDGHKEVTPPGILPPSLNPNGTGGGWGTGAGGGGAGKTVKGPDGSTTTYNPDGSRTTTHKDGAATTINPDGTSVTNNPDGSKTVLNKDGSETITYQDGTKTTVKPDGTTITQYPDGTSTKLAPNGTLTTTDAQGNGTTSHPAAGSTVKNPDGSSTVYGKDGATTTTHGDGTKTTVAANGTITTVDPDGTKTVSHLGKGTSSITYADGSVAQVGPDGTVSTTYKDGSTTKLGPDGTYTTTDADGQKKTEHLNTTGGAAPQTKHNPDGSSSTTYPDGTVDKKLKDGGHQISYPDGRTVTTDAYGRTTGATGGGGGGGGGGNGLGLGPNKTGGGLGNYDYYDYPDGKSGKSPLNGGGYGGGTGGDGAGGGRIPPLGMNPLGGQGLTPGGGMGGAAGAGAGMGGERNRSMAVGEAANARSSRAAQLASEEAAMGRRPSTSSSGGSPMMPPMGGGMGGGAGGNTQSDERERSTWVSEDEDTWGTDEGGVSAAIGR